MSYFDKYKKRVEAYGSNNSDAHMRSAVDFINREFSESPSFKVVKMGSVDTDCRMISGKASFESTLYFRPGTTCRIGDYVKDGDDTWIIFDFRDHKLNPKADIRKCTEILRWKKNESILEYPCHISNSQYDTTTGSSKGVDVVDGTLFVYVPSDIHIDEIPLSYRFLLSGKPHLVTGVDPFFRKGLMRLTMKADTLDYNDNRDDGMADNDDPREGGDRPW